MKIKTTLLVMAIFTSISCNALNYFWVGGSGSWSDFNNHWATTSGGNVFHNQVPQATDNVFFDAFSFTPAMRIVTVDQTIIQCADMTWAGLPTMPPILNGNTSDTLRIFGSLTLSTGMNFNFNGQVSMEAGTTGKTITSAGTAINASLIFNGVGGSWTLMDVLATTNVIYLNNGTLNTNNQTVKTSAFYSATSAARELNMGSSIFNLSNYNGDLWSINPVGMALNAGTSIINGICIGSGGNFYGGGLNYNDLFFTGPATGFLHDNNTINDISFASDGVIFGSNTVHDVSFGGNATIYGNPMFGPNTFNNITIAKNGTFWSGNIFNNLILSPGFTYTLPAGQIQSVGGNICAQGTGALPIRIQSSSVGSPATILKPSGTICWDYVRVSDITATGGATFNAGIAPTNSQDLGGNTGLLFTGGCIFVSCIPCSAPGITANPIPGNICAGANASFSIIANGANLTYQWQVNQGAGFINLAGATSNFLGISLVPITLNGFQYRCVVSSGSCISTSGDATLTVKPAPIVTVNSATICGGQTAILTASGADLYIWTTGNTPPPILPPPPSTIPGTGTTIIVEPVPVPPSTTSPIADTTHIDAPAPPPPIAETTIIVPPATVPPPTTGDTANPITVSPIITTSYIVTGITNGCSGTAIATVTVNPEPLVTASVSSSTVTVSATGGTPPYMGTGIFTDLAPGNYSYTVTDANGCAGSANVIVNSIPIANFNLSADTIYAGSSLIFTNTSTGFSPATKFAWNFGDICYDYTSAIGSVSEHICVDTSIGASLPISHVYNELGSYTITLSTKDLLGNSYSISKSAYVISSVTSACNSGTNCDLVCNGGFENYSHCYGFPSGAPGNFNPVTLTFTNVDYWSNLHPSSGSFLMSGTPDYYDSHVCTNNAGIVLYNNYVPDNWSGCQPGHNNSNAYIGLYTYGFNTYREYATSKLNIPMIANQYYKITYWVSLAEMSIHASYAPSAYFTINAPPTQPPITGTSNVVSVANNYLALSNSYGIITNKTGWVQISTIYLAQGNENYVTLGNFSDDINSPHTSGLSTIICTGSGAEAAHLNVYPQDANGAYYYIDDISIVPVNPITVTASQTIVCSGQTVTLTASGGNGGYTWTSSMGTISSTASTINVTPTASTTYTVTSYNTTFGCNFTQNITITVNPLPVLNTSGNIAICSGSSTTLTATGIGTFQWSTGQITSSIVVSPTSSTTYTVTLTSTEGCAKSVAIIVSVVPKPNFQITGSTTSCIASNYTASPFQPGVSYTWTTTTGLSGTGITSNVNFNPNGGTITFTGTYGGCSSSSSLYVGSCCTSPNNNIPDQNNSTAALLIAANGTGGTITDRQFSINGIFHVNKNLKLEGCTVTMGYLAKIIVDPGFTLTITATRDMSHLYACNEMWDGIYLPASSSRLIINNGTTIEDAINAVVSNNKGFFKISSTPAMGNVIFNKNLKSIVVNSAPVGGHPGSIGSTTIQCYDGVLNGNPSNTYGRLHYPHATKRSDVGVEITSVFDITIGDPSNVANTNTFDNLDNGIRTYNSSVNVYNNNFKAISYTGLPSGECFPGIAICATGLNFFNRTLKVGSNLGAPAYRNTFFNCYRGVAAKTYMNVAIWNNTFTNIVNTAVRMTSNYGRSLTANRNTINYANIGIDSYDNRGSHITINNNVLAAGLFASNEQGIRAGEIVKPSPPTVYNILDNVISNVRWGINASGLSASLIKTNSINIKHIGGQPCYGISLTNSTNSNVTGNIVKGQNKTDNWVNGIYLDLCANNRITCNTSSLLFTGLFFGGAQGPATFIAKNVMNTNYRGLVINWGTVGQQGYAGKPNDNRWTGTFTYHTYSWNSVGVNSPFYVRNASGPYNPNPYLKFSFPNFTPNFVSLIPTSGNLNSMPCPVMISTVGGGGPKKMAMQIAGDSIVPTAHIASTKWMLKQGLYEYLQTDSSLVSTEPIIAQFKAYHSQRNLGKFQATEIILGDPLTYNSSNLQTAQLFNNTVSPSSDAETNSQWMNSLLIDNAMASIDFTLAQLTDLRLLAAKCPYNDGIAVFQARTILSQYDTVEYINECETVPSDNQKSMLIQQAMDTIKTAFKLYPNPNNGNMLLDYTLNENEKGQIKIYDISGKLIISYELDNTKNQLTIGNEQLTNGVYVYYIIVNSTILKSDKLIIIK